jgi:hypothetical protein
LFAPLRFTALLLVGVAVPLLVRAAGSELLTLVSRLLARLLLLLLRLLLLLLLLLL